MLIYSVVNRADLNNIPEWCSWLEFRVDKDKSLYEELSSYANYSIILTDRVSEEGGDSTTSISEKIKQYEAYLSYSNIYFDVEIIPFLKEKIVTIIPADRLILSYHGFATIDCKLITSLVKESKLINPYIFKVAQQLDSFSEMGELLQILSSYRDKFIAVGIGRLSKISRVLYPFLGSFGTFVANMGSETVPGQLSSRECETYQLEKCNSSWMWGGIIGASQVYKSRGLPFYNSQFNNDKLNAIYLPIEIKDGEELLQFITFITTNKELNRSCYGFSVTMPFKELLPPIFNKQGINNLLIWNKEKSFYNSDEDAFIEFRNRLNLDKSSSILIYGTGSMAKLAIKSFSNYRLLVAGRDENKLQNLAKEYCFIEVIDQKRYNNYVDLLINTTSLGMNGEDFSIVTGISNYKFVIDLPYSERRSCLELQTAKEDCFSGVEFWKEQSKRQLKLFKERISDGKK